MLYLHTAKEITEEIKREEQEKSKKIEKGKKSTERKRTYDSNSNA